MQYDNLSFCGPPDEDIECQCQEIIIFRQRLKQRYRQHWGKERKPAAKRLPQTSVKGRAAKKSIVTLANLRNVMFAAKVRDLRKGGCGYAAKNHYIDLPAGEFEDLIYNLQTAVKRD